MINSLDEARKEINRIDKEMAKLFEERMACVRVIAEYKKANNLPVFDEAREDELIKNNSLLIENENIKKYYIDFLRNNMEISKKYQKVLIQKD